MSDLEAGDEEVEEKGPPSGHIKIIYLGPESPHWEFRSDFGDKDLIAEFQARGEARLLLLPPHDPQFRRNKERINRDAESQNLLAEWDLGYEEDEDQDEEPDRKG